MEGLYTEKQCNSSYFSNGHPGSPAENKGAKVEPVSKRVSHGRPARDGGGVDRAVAWRCWNVVRF